MFPFPLFLVFGLLFMFFPFFLLPVACFLPLPDSIVFQPFPFHVRPSGERTW